MQKTRQRIKRILNKVSTSRGKKPRPHQEPPSSESADTLAPPNNGFARCGNKKGGATGAQKANCAFNQGEYGRRIVCPSTRAPRPAPPLAREKERQKNKRGSRSAATCAMRASLDFFALKRRFFAVGKLSVAQERANKLHAPSRVMPFGQLRPFATHIRAFPSGFLCRRRFGFRPFFLYLGSREVCFVGGLIWS